MKITLASLATILLCATAHATTRTWQVAMPSVDADTNQGSPMITENLVVGPSFTINPATTRVVVVLSGQYEAMQRAEAYWNPAFYADASSRVSIRWFLRGTTTAAGSGPAFSNTGEHHPYSANAWTNFGVSLNPMQTFSSAYMTRVNLDVSHYSAAQKSHVKLLLSVRAHLEHTGLGNAQGSVHFLTIPSYVTLEFDAAGNFLG
jgi:hypothetical protein